MTSACCQGKEDEEKKQLMENELEMEFGCVENLEVRAQSLCKTTFFSAKYATCTRDLLCSHGSVG